MFTRDRYSDSMDSLDFDVMQVCSFSMILRVLENVRLSDSIMLHPYPDEVVENAFNLLHDLLDSSQQELYRSFALLRQKMSDDFFDLESDRLISSIA